MCVLTIKTYMNSKRVYYEIIINRLINVLDESEYTETHHIHMKCLGGGEEKNNLVRLTAREHFLCHLLLTKIYKNDKNFYHKSVKAFFMMVNYSENNDARNCIKINSKIYERLKKDLAICMSKEQKGKGNSQFGTCWINNGLVDKKIKKEELLPEGFTYGRSKTGRFITTSSYTSLPNMLT